MSGGRDGARVQRGWGEGMSEGRGEAGRAPAPIVMAREARPPVWTRGDGLLNRMITHVRVLVDQGPVEVPNAECAPSAAIPVLVLPQVGPQVCSESCSPIRLGLTPVIDRHRMCMPPISVLQQHAQHAQDD